MCIYMYMHTYKQMYITCSVEEDAVRKPPLRNHGIVVLKLL